MKKPSFIGAPIANMQYYIVDEKNEPLPPIVVKLLLEVVELERISRKTRLTAAKYLPNKFSNQKNAVMYFPEILEADL
jgi:non-ribosomal peptide synthetase component F